MATPVRAFWAVVACLLIAWALYLFNSGPKLSVDTVDVSCHPVSSGGWSDSGSTSVHRTFDVTKGELPGSAQGVLVASWEAVNGECDRRRTARLAVMLLVLTPAAVIASVAVSPVRRRGQPTGPT